MLFLSSCNNIFFVKSIRAEIYLQSNLIFASYSADFINDIYILVIIHWAYPDGKYSTSDKWLKRQTMKKMAEISS